MNDIIPRILAGYIVSELKQPLTILLVAQEKLSKYLQNNPESLGQVHTLRHHAEALNNILDKISDPQAIVKRFFTLERKKLPIAQTIQKQIEWVNKGLEEIPFKIDLEIEGIDSGYKGWIDYDKLSSIFVQTGFLISKLPGNLRTSLKVSVIKDEAQIPVYMNPSQKPLIGNLLFEYSNFPDISNDLDKEYIFRNIGKYQNEISYFYCQQLIDLHRGDTFFDQQNLRFYFTIGILSQEEEPPAPEGINSLADTIAQSETDLLLRDTFPDEQEENKVTIVVVEDEESVRNLLRDLLSDDYTVLTAENGKEALEIIHQEHPNLVISDLKMPEMDGVELCENIKNNLETSHIPVILLTAFTDIKDRIRGLKTGADHYFSKPFNAEVLLLTIENDLRNRQNIQRAFFKDSSVQPEDMNLNLADKKLLDQAIKVVKENIENPDFQVRDFADALNMATATCNRKLRGITGLTSNQFIRNIKLKEAARMLLEGEFNIGEVAFKVGFVDQRYFSRIFRQQYGLPPREYIKRIKGENNDSHDTGSTQEV